MEVLTVPKTRADHVAAQSLTHSDWALGLDLLELGRELGKLGLHVGEVLLRLLLHVGEVLLGLALSQPRGRLR